MVGTVKKSIDTTCPTWFRRNVIHACEGFLPFLGINRETVRSEISNPSLSSSPCTRGAPHNEFTAAMFLTSLRISELTRGRPGPVGNDNCRQYRLNRLRCHAITVSGRT